MVQPAPVHSLVSIRGTLGPANGPTEAWQTGFRVSPLVEGAADGPATHTVITNAVSAWFNNSSMDFSQDVALTEIRISNVTADGHAVPAVITTSTLRGAATSPKHPWQCSLVLSLLNSGKGKGSRGRMFLPPQCYAMATDGTASANPDTYLAVTKTMFNAIRAKRDIVIIGHTGGTGTSRVVDTIKMGVVVDTMRSRRRSLPEAYHSATL